MRWVSSRLQSGRTRDHRHQNRGGPWHNPWRNDAGIRIEVVVAAARHIRRRREEPPGAAAKLILVEAEIHDARPISAAVCMGKKRPDDQTPNQPSSTVPAPTRS